MGEPAEKKIKRDLLDEHDVNKKCQKHESSSSSQEASDVPITDVPITEVSQPKAEKLHFCRKHPEHQVEVYCATDEELCCVSCTLTDHKGHEFENIKEAAAKRETLILESLQDAYKKNTALKQNQETQTSSLEKMKEDSIRDINNMIEDMKLHLDQRREQLLTQLQEESSAILSTIDTSLEACHSTLAVIDSRDSFLDNNMDADGAEMLHNPDFLTSVDALQRQLETTEEEIDENLLKFSSTHKAALDELVSQFGSVCVQGKPSLADNTAARRTMTVTQQPGCTIAQGRTLTLKLYKGDLKTLPVDVIVRVVSQDLVPLGGLFESTAAPAAGPQLSDQLKGIVREEGRAPLGSVVVTDAGFLPYRNIFNLVTSYHIKGDITNCLCEVANRKLTSIAFTSFCWYERQYEDMVRAIKSFDEIVTGGSLQEVHVVASDDRHCSDFEEQMKTILPQVSQIKKVDIGVIKKHLKPSSGALLYDESQKLVK